MKYSITDLTLEELNAAIAALNKRLDESIAESIDPNERDSANMPWDARIHSTSRMRNQTDGTWRARRGVDPEVVKAVTAELLGAAPAAVEAPVVPAPPPPPPPLPVVEAPPPPLTGRDLLAQLRDVPPAQYLPIIRSHGVQNLPAILTASPEVIAKIAEALK